ESSPVRQSRKFLSSFQDRRDGRFLKTIWMSACNFLRFQPVGVGAFAGRFVLWIDKSLKNNNKNACRRTWRYCMLFQCKN
ncbi:MAG: hypothetical protein NXI02_26310, partial [Rhodobacteraceae bacterium]|nr:hypothetical protein [Paracoccaceae bacterium]